MSAEQAVVLVLLIAAFAAGWIARGASASGAPDVEDAQSEDAPADPMPAVAAALEDTVDAWLDRRDPRVPLARLDAALAGLRALDDRAIGDRGRAVLAAAHDTAPLFDRLRAGQTLDAATSRALEPLEDAVTRAVCEVAPPDPLASP